MLIKGGAVSKTAACTVLIKGGAVSKTAALC